MTAYNGGDPADQSDSIQTIHVDLATAQDAYLVYARMKRDEVENPALGEVPLWNVLKALAYSVFLQAFEVQS